MKSESDDLEKEDDEPEPGSWLSDPESWLNDQIVENEPDPDDYYDEMRERRYEIKDDGGKGNVGTR